MFLYIKVFLHCDLKGRKFYRTSYNVDIINCNITNWISFIFKVIFFSCQQPFSLFSYKLRIPSNNTHILIPQDQLSKLCIFFFYIYNWNLLNWISSKWLFQQNIGFIWIRCEQKLIFETLILRIMFQTAIHL